MVAAMTRHFACKEDDIEPGSSMTVAGSVRIALFRNDDGEYYATADRCTH